MSWSKKIVHLILLQTVLTGLLTVLSVAFAAGQVTAIYPGQIVDFSIEQQPAGSEYKWEIYCDLTVNFAQVAGNCTDGEVVDGQNSDQAQIRFSKPGEYMVKIEVWDPVACTNNMKFYLVIVEEALPTAELEIDPDEICVNEPSVLTITLTGEPLWGFTLQAVDEDGSIDLFYFENIGADDNPVEFTVSPLKTTMYTVIEVTDKNGVQMDPSGSVQLTVHPLPENSRIYVKE
jgi:hypothetical protein